MEQEVFAKVSQLTQQSNECEGVLVLDRYGLPVESSGTMDKEVGGSVCSIVKGMARISDILTPSAEDPGLHETFAQIEFERECLNIKSKDGVTLATSVRK